MFIVPIPMSAECSSLRNALSEANSKAVTTFDTVTQELSPNTPFPHAPLLSAPVRRGSYSFRTRTSTNSPLPCASECPSPSNIVASTQCLRSSSRTIRPSIRIGVHEGTGRL